MGEGLSDAEVSELARLFKPGDPVTGHLLARAGFDESRLPVNPPTSEAFWIAINLLVTQGAVANGRAQILEQALDRFPYNDVLCAADKWRVLFISANPAMDPAHARGAEISGDLELQAVLESGGPVIVRALLAATVTDLNVIRKWRPDVLHLACHGRGPLLVFDKGDGQPHTVHAGAIADTLAVYRSELNVRLRGIVVNACTSAEAGELLRPHAEVVVAHRDELDDPDAVVFAKAVYGALADTRDLAAATRIARQELVRDNPAFRRLVAGAVVLDGLR